VSASYGVNNPQLASFSYSCYELSCDFTDGSSDSDGSVVAWSWEFGDGAVSSDQNPTHTFASEGDYDVTLWVTDNEGAMDSVAQIVSVDNTTVNVPPTAAFTYICSGLYCDFDGSGSTDSDGTIVSYEWIFGDGATANGQTTSHAFGTDGEYDVSLTVTDNLGATDSENQLVSVTGGVIELLLDTSAETTSASRWKAIVEDLNGNELHGSWSASGSSLCIDSVCTLSNIHKKVLSVIFTADATGEQVTIDKP